MIEGYNPKAGASLRTMYNDAPKGTGRQKAGVKTGARHDTDKPAKNDDAGEQDDEQAAPAQSKDDIKRAAITALFGHCDDELIAAIAWAAAHEPRFVNLVKTQIALDAKPSKATAPKQLKAA